MTSTIMHVGIEEPIMHRKEILDIGIDIIQALKEFEIHKKINKEKAVYRKHFIMIVKELSNGIHELKDMLPAVYTHHPKPEEKEAVEPKVEKVKVVKKPVHRQSSELTKLEDDIAALKNKIATL